VAINKSRVPKVLLTRMRVDFQKELGLAFGDYWFMTGLTIHCNPKVFSIALYHLYPCNNVASLCRDLGRTFSVLGMVHLVSLLYVLLTRY
jgi:hypothetical protein